MLTAKAVIKPDISDPSQTRVHLSLALFCVYFLLIFLHGVNQIIMYELFSHKPKFPIAPIELALLRQPHLPKSFKL